MTATVALWKIGLATEMLFSPSYGFLSKAEQKNHMEKKVDSKLNWNISEECGVGCHKIEA